MRHCLAALIALLFLTTFARADAPRVVVIDLHGSLSSVRADWADSQIDAARKSGASGVILDFDSTSGSMDAAKQLERYVLAHSADIPIAGYVHTEARGPASLVAIACKPLAMAPGGSLGGASSDASPADFQAAAEAGGRNPAYAAAFVAADSALPAVHITPGSALTLTTQQAQSVGYADVVAPDYPAVLAKMNLPGAQIVPANWTTWTSIAWWVSRPWLTILLLGLGIALIVGEMLTWHSWGLAGVLGGIMVALIFAAHITVGAAGWAGAILFLAGIVLLILETHVFPGHGLAALSGLVLIFLGMFFALGGAQAGALYSAGAALLATLGFLAAFFVYLPRSPIWKRLGQPMRQSAAAGYVASQNYVEYVGQTGIAVTPLRPSGTAEVDGSRLSVVTEGEFIPSGTPIQVVAAQGGRIVVRTAEPAHRV
jgi:membrane-bound serine protease (ClpP class)